LENVLPAATVAPTWGPVKQSFLGIGIRPPTPNWGNMLGGVLAEATSHTEQRANAVLAQQP
jgi:hypothetical protein